MDAPTMIGHQRQPELPARPPERRRWVVPVAVVGALAVGAAAAIVATSTLGEDDATAATTLPAPVATPPPTLPSDVSAFAPIELATTIDGDAIFLTWRDRTGGTSPQIASAHLPDGVPQSEPVDAGMTSTGFAGLDVTAPMCFTVSAVLGIDPGSGAAVTADSEPHCINGATAQLVDR